MSKGTEDSRYQLRSETWNGRKQQQMVGGQPLVFGKADTFLLFTCTDDHIIVQL